MMAAELRRRLQATEPVRRSGRLIRAEGLLLESQGPLAALGEVCYVMTRGGQLPCEVVALRDRHTLLAPLGEVPPLFAGAEVVASGWPLEIGLGPGVLGRVLDPLGLPLDGRPPWQVTHRLQVVASPPQALERPPIATPLATGVRALDALLTVGRGQRLGLFAGSGVGKSTLLAMLARHGQAPVVVAGLVGERGREVREFLSDALGEEGSRRAVTVVATSDQPALLRIKAALLATRIAEYFRDQGFDVMLLLDSLTRVAAAQREVGVAVGEPVAGRGYPPSVFALLPRLVERAGPAAHGSITAFYTVLVEADDMNDPVADSVRSLLDGHVVLSRALAERGHFPAIDVLASTSRLADRVTPREVRQQAVELRRLLAAYRDAADLVRIGAYREGSDALVDRYRALEPRIEAFLTQELTEASTLAGSWQALREVLA